MIINLLIMLSMSMTVVMVFRHIDKNNRSFDKIATLYKKIKSEFMDLAQERQDALKAYDDSIEVSLHKGDSMIQELKRTLVLIEDKKDELLGSNEVLTNYMNKINFVGSSVEEVASKVADLTISEDFIKSIDGKVSDFRKELALVDRDLNRIEDNFKKENTLSLKDVTNKILKEVQAEVEALKKDTKSAKNTFEADFQNMYQVLEEKEKIHESNNNAIYQRFNDTKETVLNQISNLEQSVDRVVVIAEKESIAKFEKYKMMFSELENDFSSVIEKEKDLGSNHIKTMLSEALNEINSFIAEEKNTLFNSLSVLTEKSGIETERLFAHLKTIEERVSEQILDVDDKSKNLDGYINSFENKLKEITIVQENQFSEVVNSIVGDMDDFEHSVFGALKNKINRFQERFDEQLLGINEIIEKKIEVNLNNSNVAEIRINELENNIVGLRELYEEKNEEIKSDSELFKTSALDRIALAKQEISEQFYQLRNQYDNEKSELLDKIVQSLEKTGNESEKKVSVITERIESMYNDFNSKLIVLEDEMVLKTSSLSERFDEKIIAIDEIVHNKEHYVTSLIKTRLDDCFRDAESLQNSFKTKVHLYEDKLGVAYNDFAEKSSNTEFTIKTKNEEMSKKFQEMFSQYQFKIDELNESYKENTDSLIKENSLKLCSLEDQYDLLKNTISDYQCTISSDIIEKSDYIQSKVDLLSDIVESAHNDVENTVKMIKLDAAEKTETIVEQYSNELLQLKESSQKTCDILEQKLSTKYNEIDHSVLTRMKDINELVEKMNELSKKYSEKMNTIDEKINETGEVLGAKLESIDDEYRSVQKNLIDEVKDSVVSFENRFQHVQDKIDELNKGFGTDLDYRIVSAKSEIESIINNGSEKLNNQLQITEKDIDKKFSTFTDMLSEIKSSYKNLEYDFEKRYSLVLDESNETYNDRMREFIENHSSKAIELTDNLVTLERMFTQKMTDLETDFESRFNSVVNDKINFIAQSESRLQRIDDQLSSNELRMDTELDEKLESARILIDSFFDSSHNNLVEKYNELEKETVGSIDVYKNELKRIQQNIKVIDDKFGVKFAKKLEKADLALDDQLKTLENNYVELINKFNEKILSYDQEYQDKLSSIECDFTEKNKEIIENSRYELSNYTDKIEMLMKEISEVRLYLEKDFNSLVENGKVELKTYLTTEKQNTELEYKNIENGIHELIDSYKNQINKIKDGLKSVDEKMNMKIAEKINETDIALKKKYQDIDNSYSENVAKLKERIKGIEDVFAEKIEGLEEIYSNKGETYIIESYNKFHEISSDTELIAKEVEYLKRSLDGDIANKIQEGKGFVDALFAENKEELEEYNEILKVRLKSTLDERINEIDNLKTHISNLESKLKTEVTDKIIDVENKIGDKFAELNKAYSDQITDVKTRISGFEDGFSNKLQNISNSFEVKHEELLFNSNAKLNNYTFKIKEIESSIDDLKNRIELEIENKIDETLKDSYEIINNKGNDVVSLYENTTNEFKNKLSSFETQVEEKLLVADNLFNDGLNAVKDKINSLTEEVYGDFSMFKDHIETEGKELQSENSKVIDKISSKYDQLQNMLQSLESNLNGIELIAKADGKRITQEFREMFVTFVKEAEKEKGALYAESSEELNNLMVKFSGLQSDIVQYKNKIDNSITEKLVENIQYVDKTVKDKISILQNELSLMEDTISISGSNQQQKIEELNNKLFSFDKLFIESLEEKIGSSDKLITDKVKALEVTVDSLESIYSLKTNEIDSNISAVENRLNDIQEQKKTEIVTFYSQINKEIDELKKQKNNEINSLFEKTETKVDQMLNSIQTNLNAFEKESEEKFTTLSASLLSDVKILFNEQKESMLSEQKESNSQIIKDLDIQKNNINTIHKELSNLESHFSESLMNKIKESDSEISSSIEKLQSNINEIENSYTNNLTNFIQSLTNSSEKEISKVKDEMIMTQNMYQGLEDSITVIKNKIDNEITEKIVEGVNKVSGIIDEKIVLTQNELADSLLIAESKIDSLNKMIGSIETVYSRIDDEISARIKSQTSDEIFAVKADISKQQYDLKFSLDAVHKELNAKIDSYRSILDGFNSEIDKSKLNVENKLNNSVLELEENITSKVNTLSNELEKIDSQYKIGLNEMVREFQEKGDDTLGRISEKMNTYTNSINDFEIKLKEMYVSQRKELENELELLKDKYIVQEDERSQTVYLLMKNVEDKLNAIQKRNELVEVDVQNVVDSSHIVVTEYTNNIKSEYEELKNEFNQYRISSKLSIENDADNISNLINNLENKLAQITNINQNSINERFEKLDSQAKLASEGLIEFTDSTKESLLNEIKLFKNEIMIKKEEINSFKQELTSSVEKELQNVSLLFSNTSNKFSDKFDVINNELESFKLSQEKKIEVHENGLNDQLTSMQDNFNEIFLGIQNDIDSYKVNVYNEIDSKISGISSAVQTLDQDISNKIDLINTRFVEYTEKIESDIDLSKEQVEISFDKLQSELENKYNIAFKQLQLAHAKSVEDVHETINLSQQSIEERYKNEIDIVIKDFKTSVQGNSMSYENHIKLLEDKYKNKILDMQNDFENATSTNSLKLSHAIQELESSLLVVENKIDNRHNELDKKYENSTNNIEKNLEEIQATVILMRDQLEKEIASISSNIVIDVEKDFTEKQFELTNQFRDIEKEMIEKINNYRAEMHKVQQNLSGIEIKFNDLFTRKMGDYDAKLSDKFVEIKQLSDDSLTILNDKLKEVAKNFSTRFDVLEDIYNEKSDSMLLSNAKKMDDLENRFSSLTESVRVLCNTVQDEVSLTIEHGKEEVQEILLKQIAEAKDQFNIASNEINKGIGDFRNEFIKIQNSMKSIDDKFTARFIEHSNVLGKRISSIETEVGKFEKNLLLVEKTNSMKEKLNDEMKDIKSKISLIKVDKEALQKIEKNISNIESLAKLSEDKYSKLFSDAKKLDNITEVLEELTSMTDNVEQKIEHIKNAKVLINNVESTILAVMEKSKNLESELHKLDSKQQIVSVSMDSIDSARNEANELRGMISELHSSYDQLDFKRETYEKSIKDFEKDAVLIMKSQNKIDDIMSRFKQMDHFVEDLESRTNSIMKLREWLVKAETQMENLNFETDKRIRTLEVLNSGSEKNNNNKSDINKQEDSKRKMVIELKKDGWAIDEIAKTSGLSIGEVEFILDLEISTVKK